MQLNAKLSINMKVFKYLYIAVATIFTMLCLWIAFVGLAGGNFALAGIGVFVSFLLWVGALKAANENKRDAAITCGIPALISLPLVYRLFQRVVFVSENGGMERADGYGSPLAFVVGLSFELMLFIPLLFLFVVGLRYFFRVSSSHA